MKELYKKHRPTNLGQIRGQSSAVKVLRNFIKHKNIPRYILFIGPTGCGKTTMARILRKELHCSKYDFEEAAPRKIEEVREIKSRMHLTPLKSKCRIWLIDECHKLTSDAQDDFLKMLEDTPSHVYFILTTIYPQKLKPEFKSRGTKIVVHPLKDEDLADVIIDVCKKERKKIPKEVIQKIILNSNGSARSALVYLHKVINLKSKSEQLNAIVTITAETQAIEIARALFKTKTNWFMMTKILKETEGEEPEQIRWMVLGYAKTVMLKTNDKAMIARAYLIIEAFRNNFYNTKMAGLVAACYEIIVGED